MFGRGKYETTSKFGCWLPRAPLRNHGVLLWTARIYFSAITALRWQVFFDFADLPDRSHFDECAECECKSIVGKGLRAVLGVVGRSDFVP